MLTLPMYLRQFEVAELLSVTKNSVRRYEQRGQLTPIRDGRDVYYRREEVVGLFEQKHKK